MGLYLIKNVNTEHILVIEDVIQLLKTNELCGIIY